MVLWAGMGMARDHLEIVRDPGNAAQLVSLRTLAGLIDMSVSGTRKFVRRHQLRPVRLGHRSPRYALREIVAILDRLEEERG